MDPRRLIHRLLAVLAIAGLFAAPLMAPAKRMTAADMTAIADHEMAGHVMSADTPCCPDSQSDGNGCPDCPLMAMCTLSFVQAEPPAGAALPAMMPAPSRFSASEDTFADGLGGAPPDHPPRSLI